MCHVCQRRGFLARATALSALAFAPGAFAADGPTTSVTADEALARLQAGNAKYVQGPELCVAELARQRDRVAQVQQPWATVLACADSRVAPELLFGGVGPGELFVARNAGNMADTATMGSIEYGAAVLGVPLVVVLGHARCGAVAAACNAVRTGAKFPGSIGPMVDAIVPAARAVAGRPGDMVENAVRESALRTAKQVATASPIVADLVAKGKVKVVAARYGLDDGRVEFLA